MTLTTKQLRSLGRAMEPGSDHPGDQAVVAYEAVGALVLGMTNDTLNLWITKERLGLAT